MVFLIQASQNRSERTIQLKLDELILAIENASDDLIEIETSAEEQLRKIKETHAYKRQKNS